MNPILHSAAETARLGWAMGIVTVVFLVCFAGWTWWAWSASNRARFEQDGRMPLREGDEP